MMDLNSPVDSKNTLENYPNLTFVEIDLIIQLVGDDGKKMASGEEVSRNNYKQIRAAYATVLLSLAQLEGVLDKVRTNALEKLNKVNTEELNVKVTLDIDSDRAGYFIDELETLLAKYAEPSHKYRLQFHDKPEAAETNIEMNAPGL